jgi:hypothetical protein
MIQQMQWNKLCEAASDTFNLNTLITMLLGVAVQLSSIPASCLGGTDLNLTWDTIYPDSSQSLDKFFDNTS